MCILACGCHLYVVDSIIEGKLEHKPYIKLPVHTSYMRKCSEVEKKSHFLAHAIRSIAKCWKSAAEKFR